jgi:hypothetical protein
MAALADKLGWLKSALHVKTPYQSKGFSKLLKNIGKIRKFQPPLEAKTKAKGLSWAVYGLGWCKCQIVSTLDNMHLPFTRLLNDYHEGVRPTGHHGQDASCVVV